MVRHWTPKPVITSCIRLSPTGGTFFFAVVNSFEYNNAISANFVQTVKNSTGILESVQIFIKSNMYKFGVVLAIACFTNLNGSERMKINDLSFEYRHNS